ncbi:hypothetical protein BGW42_002757 [Actinomortierella wolfii]|nr:hypothetical protein BGW42_002757 [Actinomortierella wolfii]
MATVSDEKKVIDEKHPVDEVKEGIELRPDDEYVLDYDDATTPQFTWRAAIVGSLLGCVVAASNLYVGLKVGWTFGASLWGAIFGFIILKPLSRFIGSTAFGPKENATCQAAATAAGGLSAGYVTAVPALYRLGLMPTGHIPRDDWVTLLLWTLSAAFFGMFFAVPLRSHFVINQELPFPTPRAAAETIKALHRGGEEAAGDARKTGYFLFGSFGASFLISLGAHWVTIMESIHFLYYIGKASGYTAMMNADLLWGWSFSWDFAFFGAGLMTPGSTVFSFLLGDLIAYGIAGPLMTDSGYLVGKGGFKPGVHTAQSWFLWPGIALMIFTSFGELAVHGRSLWNGLKGAVFLIRNGIRRIIRRFSHRGASEDDQHISVSKDPVPDHLQVPLLWWLGGFVVSLIFTVCVMSIGFKVPVWATLVAILMSFLLAFVALQAAGETDINPTGPVSKLTQVVFSRVPGLDTAGVQKTNLMCANITASICSQATDMVGDLKTGHLLAASPRSQFFAQIVGSVFAVVVAIPLFILYTSAYKCIIDPTIGECPFELNAVIAWENVCKLLTGGNSFIPKESIITTVVCIFLALFAILIRVKVLPERFRPYWINMNAVGIGFINSSPAIPICMVVSWTIGTLWKRYSPRTHEKFMYSIAAGLISGVGVSGIIKAFLTLSDVPGSAVEWGCLRHAADGKPC